MSYGRPAYTRVLEVPDEEPIRVLEVHDLGAVTAGGLSLPFETPFMRIKVTGELQIFNSDQNKYHTLLVQGNVGEEYITISAGES